jgi:hypothetical protein
MLKSGTTFVTPTDIVVAAGPSVLLLYQLEDRIFSEPVRLVSESVQGAYLLTLADLDADQDIDIVTANSLTGNVGLWLQESPGTHVLSVIGNATVSLPSTIATGDLDGDGDLDIVCSNIDLRDFVVFYQEEPGRFPLEGRVTLLPRSSPPQMLLIADVDRNTTDDIVIADGSGKILLYPQDPGFGLRDKPTTWNTVDAPPAWLEFVDVDADGDGDLVGLHRFADKVTVHWGGR